jgi:hypothetical protein
MVTGLFLADKYHYGGLQAQRIDGGDNRERDAGASSARGGFPEVVYQRSLAIELRHISLQFEQEIHSPLYYRGESVGSRRADFLVE